MKSMALAIITTLFLCESITFGHGDEGGELPPNEDPVVPIDQRFFDDVVYPIVESSCISCHNSEFASGGHSFETSVELASHSQLIIQTIEGGTMPLGNPEWINTTEATIFLYWLNHQEEVPHEEIP